VTLATNDLKQYCFSIAGAFEIALTYRIVSAAGAHQRQHIQPGDSDEGKLRSMLARPCDESPGSDLVLPGGALQMLLWIECTIVQ